MFQFLNTQSRFDKIFQEFDNQFSKQFDALEKQIESISKIGVQPIVTQSDDAVTVTFRGPNVTTTVTASKVDLPGVLKQFGLEMPKVATKVPVKKAARKAKNAS